ncbi:hypothetical protein Clacol_002521 [Clathrus columnatus]|uniref:CS domain-containing protein n=1 Tax=Clathrus columnatus TaxID=1419009 RepID=A0AAV5A233_9AGAM|nr:hypothetical protein Clacol_002521 [Clathrus columnatus]
MNSSFERLQRYSWHQGQLYGAVDTANSSWQLEPRATHRGRTISSTSSHSSFAVVSDHDLSSFTVSLESGRDSETDDYADLVHSPALSSPSTDERALISRHRDEFVMPQIPGLSSPPMGPSVTSSFSSTESLSHSSRSGRLLTLHLEKTQSVIWPSLIIGPVPPSLSPLIPLPERWGDPELRNNEGRYNMDPTSLSLMAIDMLDIRQERVDAFEYLVRAWHQSRIPVSTLRLVNNYIPLHSSNAESLIRETRPYYITRIGGPAGLAQLYLEAGQLYLEGSASLILASSTPIALSSIRTSEPFIHPSTRESGTETWRKDREAARCYFDRAKSLDPTLEVPILPSDNTELEKGQQRNGPLTPQSASDISRTTSQKGNSNVSDQELQNSPIKRLRKGKELVDPYVESEEHDMWYFYLPGVISAVLAVGVLLLSYHCAV